MNNWCDCTECIFHPHNLQKQQICKILYLDAILHHLNIVIEESIINDRNMCSYITKLAELSRSVIPVQGVDHNVTDGLRTQLLSFEFCCLQILSLLWTEYNLQILLINFPNLFISMSSRNALQNNSVLETEA